jgi:hypothetical protein
VLSEDGDEILFHFEPEAKSQFSELERLEPRQHQALRARVAVASLLGWSSREIMLEWAQNHEIGRIDNQLGPANLIWKRDAHEPSIARIVEVLLNPTQDKIDAAFRRARDRAE